VLYAKPAFALRVTSGTLGQSNWKEISRDTLLLPAILAASCTAIRAHL